MRNAAVGISVVVLFVLGACVSEPGRSLGEACFQPMDCASGMCATGGFCTAACTTDSECEPAGSFEVFVCDASACAPACTTNDTRGSGATTEICSRGHFGPCSAARPGDACPVCGCEPFGGGTCVERVGCFVPMPDGAPCTRDEECTSGACYRDTDVCGPPRAMGQPCSVDAECVSLNCSTDGDATLVGHCNQPLGTGCGSSAREEVTETCTRCKYTFGETYGICFRAGCHPVTANHCQSFSGHEFECAQSTSGEYHCFELCAYEGDDCWYDTVYCYSEGDYCR